MTKQLDNTYQIAASPTRKRTRIAWLYLALAIASEVVGLVILQASSIDGQIAGYVWFYLMIAFSYVCLAQALKQISVGVAYAIWEGSGIAIITLVSAAVLQQALTLVEVVGLLMATIGILLVKAGEETGMPPTKFTK